MKDVAGDWICLEFRRSVLRSKFGIVVRDEEAMPVGQKQVNMSSNIVFELILAHFGIWLLFLFAR